MWNTRMFMFFFSSRRRHTRFDCDWSSDVCSSDLLLHEVQVGKDGSLKNAIVAVTGINDEKFQADFTGQEERKSTPLNSSHSPKSYAVFCFKKKKKRIVG